MTVAIDPLVLERLTGVAFLLLGIIAFTGVLCCRPWIADSDGEQS